MSPTNQIPPGFDNPINGDRYHEFSHFGFNSTSFLFNSSGMDFGNMEPDFLRLCINHEVSNSDSNLEFCRSFFAKTLLFQSLEVKIPLFILYCVIFIIGFFGNVSVFLSIILFKFMRSKTNLFLLNLAISDLLVFLTCFPLNAFNQIYPDWLFGHFLCKLWPFLQGVCVSVSIASLASISIKRFVIIRYPIRAKSKITNLAIIIWIISIWILSTAICLPLYFANEIEESVIFLGFKNTVCKEKWKGSIPKKQAYTIFLFTFLYLIPLVFMTIFYSMLGKTLVSTIKFARESSRMNQDNQNSRNIRTVSQERQKITHMMIALLVAFGFCWAPYHFVNIYTDFVHVDSSLSMGNSTEVQNSDSQSSVAISQILPIVTLLGYLNSAINPLCLIIISSKFRACFYLLVRCNCRGHMRQASYPERRDLTLMPSAVNGHRDDHELRPLPQFDHILIRNNTEGTLCTMTPRNNMRQEVPHDDHDAPLLARFDTDFDRLSYSSSHSNECLPAT